MRRIAVAVVLCVCAACQLPYGGAGGVIFGRRNVPPRTTVDIGALEDELLDEVNDARDEHDVPALAIHAGMMRAARDHAAELASRHVLDHTSVQAGRETLAKRLAAAGAPNWTLAGENLIQLPFTSTDVAAEAIRGWLDSPSHRQQMLETSYTDTGIGVVRDAHGDWFIVQLFIRRR
jgi:uncharacterized protein YkwD